MNIYYYNPSDGIGGEVISNLRVASWLREKYGFNVNIIDFKNGYVFDYMDKNSIKGSKMPLEIKPNGRTKRVKLGDDSVLILNAAHIFGKRNFLKNIKCGPETKVLFYFVEPNTIEDGIKKKLKGRISKSVSFFILMHRLGKVLNVINEKKAFFCQDYPNFTGIKKYFAGVNEYYIPVALNNPEMKKSKFFDKNNLSFCWIGRESKSKNTTLFFYFENLKKYALTNPGITLKFYVVSNKFILNDAGDMPANMEVIFKSNLYEKELYRFLCGNADIVLAMGLSCFEGALCGLPAISAPASLKPIALNTPVSLIYDFKGYSSGGYIKNDNGYIKQYDFAELIDKIRNSYKDISEKCHKYVLERYNVDKVAARLLKTINNSEMTVGDLEKINGNKRSFLL